MPSIQLRKSSLVYIKYVCGIYLATSVTGGVPIQGIKGDVSLVNTSVVMIRYFNLVIVYTLLCVSMRYLGGTLLS